MMQLAWLWLIMLPEQPEPLELQELLKGGLQQQMPPELRKLPGLREVLEQWDLPRLPRPQHQEWPQAHKANLQSLPRKSIMWNNWSPSPPSPRHRLRARLPWMYALGGRSM